MSMPCFSAAALAAVLLAGCAAPAFASSDAAWAEFNGRATRACAAASGLRVPRVSPIIGFDDRVATTAMLVTGRTRWTRATKLCLYDKRARRAYVDEADGWSAPTTPG